jgi:NDP-hexose 4-ketoreductase
MQIIGRGFLARNLADALAGRHPDVTAFAAGVSSTSVTAAPELDREAQLLYQTLRGCRRLVFFSTASFAMYGSTSVPAPETGPLCPPSVYGRHKLALESCVRTSGADFLILRLSHLVGPHQRPHQLLPGLAGQIRGGEVTIHRGAHRDLLDVRELVAIVDRLLARGIRNEVLNVVSGVPHPVDRIVDGIERRLGVTARRTYVPGTVSRTLVSTERLRRLVPEAAARLTTDLDSLLDRYVPDYAPIMSGR